MVGSPSTETVPRINDALPCADRFRSRHAQRKAGNLTSLSSVVEQYLELKYQTKPVYFSDQSLRLTQFDATDYVVSDIPSKSVSLCVSLFASTLSIPRCVNCFLIALGKALGCDRGCAENCAIKRSRHYLADGEGGWSQFSIVNRLQRPFYFRCEYFF